MSSPPASLTFSATMAPLEQICCASYNTDLLTWAFGNAKIDPDQKIWIDAVNPSRSITYIEARTFVRKVIAGFKATGLRIGDVVCVHAFNDIYYSLFYLAIIGAGGVFVGANPGHKFAELHHLLELTEVKYIITEKLWSIYPAAAKCGVKVDHIFTCSDDIGEGEPDSTPVVGVYPQSTFSLLEHGESEWMQFDDEQTARGTMAAIMMTSGTTGWPKAALYSHFSCVQHGAMLQDVLKRPYEIKRLMLLPPFHSFAAPLAHIVPLREGQLTYTLPRFEVNEVVDVIQRFGITDIPMVPTMLRLLVQQSASLQDKLSSLRSVIVGGAPLGIDLQMEFSNLLHDDARVLQLWGMTEAGGWMTSVDWNKSQEMMNTVGKCITGIQGRIVDEDGKVVTEDGFVGNVQMKGPIMMSGYLKNEKETKDSITPDGWIKTGDVAFVRDGNFFIVDRSKDMIKVRSWQVSPAEIEGFLCTHPFILDAAVIGINKGQDGDEQPKAFVVRLSPELTEDVVKKFVKDNLIAYKQLRGGVEFVESIAKNPTGKILKTKLRDLEKARKMKELEMSEKVEQIEKVDVVKKLAGLNLVHKEVLENDAHVKHDDKHAFNGTHLDKHSDLSSQAFAEVAYANY